MQSFRVPRYCYSSRIMMSQLRFSRFWDMNLRIFPETMIGLFLVPVRHPATSESIKIFRVHLAFSEPTREELEWMVDTGMSLEDVRRSTRMASERSVVRQPAEDLALPQEHNPPRQPEITPEEHMMMQAFGLSLEDAQTRIARARSSVPQP